MIGALFSGGKDSVFAMYKLIREGKKIGCLISLKSKNKDSWMFHTPAMNMVKLQSEALEIPILISETDGEKEKELDDLKRALENAKKEYKITGVVAGALFSEYQYERVKKLASSLGLEAFAPLWHRNQAEVLEEIIDSGFEVIVTKVASAGLGEKWLGRKIGKKELNELIELNKKLGVHVCGEGGEFESLVIDGPIFKKRIELIETEKRMTSDITGVLEIKEAKLVEK